jgi:hypothetical protein
MKISIKYEKLLTVFGAAYRIASYCERGDVINFDNNSDEAYGEKIIDALENLTDIPCRCDEVAIIENAGWSPICPVCGGNATTRKTNGNRWRTK